MKLFQHLLIIMSSVVSSIAFAAPASDQQVQQLLKVMNIDEILTQTMQQIRPQLDQQAYEIVKMTVKKDQLNPQEQIIANELADKIFEQSKKTVAWDQIKPLYLKIYKEVYNADEVQAQINFYSSPIGQSILKKTPQITQESMKIVNTQLMSSIQTTMNDFKEIDKKLDALKKAAQNK